MLPESFINRVNMGNLNESFMPCVKDGNFIPRPN